MSSIYTNPLHSDIETRKRVQVILPYMPTSGGRFTGPVRMGSVSIDSLEVGTITMDALGSKEAENIKIGTAEISTAEINRAEIGTAKINRAEIGIIVSTGIADELSAGKIYIGSEKNFRITKDPSDSILF